MYAIVEYVDEHGHGPTLDELGAMIGCGRSAAHDLVSALRRMGLLQSGYGRHRQTVPSVQGYCWIRTLPGRLADRGPGA